MFSRLLSPYTSLLPSFLTPTFGNSPEFREILKSEGFGEKSPLLVKTQNHFREKQPMRKIHENSPPLARVARAPRDAARFARCGASWPSRRPRPRDGCSPGYFQRSTSQWNRAESEQFCSTFALQPILRTKFKKDIGMSAVEMNLSYLLPDDHPITNMPITFLVR